jgi:hypothetical protein
MAANNPVPGTVVPVGSAVGPGGSQGTQGVQGLPGPQGVPTGVGFITKTAAYTITPADSGKYILCSGGSWPLTLPTAAAGLYFQVKNDMGISGVTGTITVLPTGGATINGQGSLPLLAQQDCTIITDGTNWRTFGLQRDVVIGTITTSAAQATVPILLPVGYSIFDIDIASAGVDTGTQNGFAQFSNNGGSSWLTSNYYGGVIYNNAATTVAYSNEENVASVIVAASSQLNTTVKDQIKLTVYPGTPSLCPTLLSYTGSRAGTYQQCYVCYGQYNTAGVINALQFFWGAGNVLAGFYAIVKGRV